MSVENQTGTIKAKLIIKTGRLAGTELELKAGANSVGRSPEADVCIPEPSISTQHCQLNVAEIGIGVHDLNSTNGTFINGARISHGVLQMGDALTLGEVQVAVEMPEVHIALPETPLQEAPGAAFLEDGSPACQGHRDRPALHRCIRCENWWCGECVRQLKRLSGDFITFCPECSAACAPLAPSTSRARKSFLQRVGDTLRLPRKK